MGWKGSPEIWPEFSIFYYTKGEMIETKFFSPKYTSPFQKYITIYLHYLSIAYFRIFNIINGLSFKLHHNGSDRVHLREKFLYEVIHLINILIVHFLENNSNLKILIRLFIFKDIIYSFYERFEWSFLTNYCFMSSSIVSMERNTDMIVWYGRDFFVKFSSEKLSPCVNWTMRLEGNCSRI